MLIQNNNGSIVAGWVINEPRQKEYQGKQYFEVPIRVGKDIVPVNINVWERNPGIKKYDRVLAVGQLKTTTKNDKTYYYLTADYIAKESCITENKMPPGADNGVKTEPQLQPIDVSANELPF